MLLIPERFNILHLLIESIVYDNATGELELTFYPLGITSLAAEPRGHIPRVARLLALAHHFEELLATGAVETQAELAELASSPPRVSPRS